VTVDVTCDQVRNGPQWDPREPITPQFEEDLSRYYAGQRVGTPAPKEVAAMGAEGVRSV
jgi:hypothetical protein